jgi:vitamin B12 transporter
LQRSESRAPLRLKIAKTNTIRIAPGRTRRSSPRDLSSPWPRAGVRDGVRMFIRCVPLTLAIASVLSCSFAAAAHAQNTMEASGRHPETATENTDENTEENSPASSENLDRVVVTATRTAITADAALAPLQIIDRAQIERSQSASLADLLRGRAGINLSNQGGDGKLTSVFVRGAESDHVLVLIDGIRIGSATSGAAAFQDLPLEIIDRIEIVRGPRSSLYGSDAIGGVIQIFTRRDRGPAQGRFALGIGSHGRREAGAGIGGGNERGWYGVDAAYLRTDGINACDGAGFPIFAGCFVDDETDRDGHARRALSLRGGVSLGERAQLDGQWLEVRGENEYDGSFVNYSETTQRVIGGKLHWETSERTTLQITAGRNRDASDNFIDTPTGRVANGDFASDRDSASLQLDIALADAQTLTIGADWLRDRIETTPDYDVKSRRNVAAFAQYQARFDTRIGAQDVQVAMRRDDSEQFGGETTGTAAWGLGFADGWRVTAGYGTGFKAPTFNELYFPFFGNPTLRPESSRTIEAGLAWRNDRTTLRLDAFETDVDDLIAFDVAIFLPNNIDRARLRGVELQLDSAIAEWEISFAASWLDPENRSAGNRGNDLPRRARESARLSVDRAFGAWRLGATVVGEGGRYDDLANTRRLGGYATVDLRGEYTFGDAWTLQAGIANVFDRDYETVAFYNQLGRTYQLRLRYSPKP